MPQATEIRTRPYPFATTDIIIEYAQQHKKGIVLIERKNPPYGLALPGGFAECGISLDENARKEAREETGLELVISDPTKPWRVFSQPNRDPRGHMVSVTYICEGHGTLRAGDDAKKARLYTIPEVKNLLGKNQFAFDHEQIITQYMQERGHL